MTLVTMRIAFLQLLWVFADLKTNSGKQCSCVQRGLSLFFLNNLACCDLCMLDSRVKTKGGWFFILGFNMLNFQICQTQHVKHNFYRQSLF